MARTFSGKKPKRLGYTVKTFLSYLGRHKFLLLAVGVLVAVSATANLLGTYMIRPVVNALVSGNMETLIQGIALTVVIYGVGVLCSFGYTQTMVRAAQKVLLDIRRDLFAHLQTLPLRFFDTRRHGDIMSYFTNDVDTIADALNNSFAMAIQSFIQMTGTLILLFVLNWQLSLVVVVCYAAMFAYIRFSSRRSRTYYTKQQACLGDLDGYIQEMVNGQKVVQVFNHEQASMEIFDEKNEALRRAGTGAQGYAATMIPAVVTISYINYAIVSVLGGIMALKGMTDAGSLASYLVFVRQAAAPINQFTQQSNFLLAALAGAERVFEVMDEAPEVDEGAVSLEKAGQGWAWHKPEGADVPLRGDVRFEHVDFGYEPGHPVLRDVSLYAKPGQKIAFVGSTGAGKTTITNLINRFYDVQGGRILYDGIDVRDIQKSALRSSLGIVLQDTHLFTGTIADNIRFGKLDATMEEIREAARAANALEFIEALPQGFDTITGERGIKLSGGQRQRIAIARAMLADCPILVLDEATSALDSESEAAVQEALARLMEGRTAIVVAHRLSTVASLDRIVVLSQGRIVEDGPHAELVAKGGDYARLWNRQTGAFAGE